VIGLDTNVLVRYLTQDDPAQAALATRVMEQDLSAARPGFISTVVLVETAWVLERLYKATREEILEIVSGFLGSPLIFIENRAAVIRAMTTARRHETGFADAVIAALAFTAGCDTLLTFDRGAVDAGMTLLE
jgi:predicted nucleic-acid-binding protein